jgi:hypothetical protein
MAGLDPTKCRWAVARRKAGLDEASAGPAPYRPLKSGLRFSLKALIPSIRSSVGISW